MPVDDQYNWMQTYTRKRAEFTRPNSAIVDIEDIARSLSRICRYNGHTKRHYSVAEHSIYVSRRAAALFDQHRGKRYSAAWASVMRRDVARAGLLHDASEAYLGDISRGLKHDRGMYAYRKLEKEWQYAILEAFNMNVHAPEVDVADKELLGTEVQLLPGGPRHDWPPLAQPLPIRFVGWPAWFAYRMFMREYRRLFGNR